MPVRTRPKNMHLGQLSAWRRVQGMGRVSIMSPNPS
jgi:hypothetical protein